MAERVFIAIGSNIGDKAANCREAVRRLSGRVTLVRESPMYETEPWGVAEQPEFVNMAVEAATDLGPRELLELLKETEREMGRTPGERWGPRLIDLDIIFYGDRIVDEPGLKVPHPGAHERLFVLRPLNDIAPEFVHPVLKKTVSELLRSATPRA